MNRWLLLLALALCGCTATAGLTDVRLFVELDRVAFHPGEQLNVTVWVHNAGDGGYAYVRGSCGPHETRAFVQGAPLPHADGLADPPGPCTSVYHTIHGGASLGEAYTWDGRDAQGQPLPAGAYRITAQLAAQGGPYPVRGEANVTLLPPGNVTLDVTADRPSIEPGEVVHVHAVLTNRGFANVTYDDACGAPWTFEVWNTSGPIAHEPVMGRCQAIAYATLPPRGNVTAEFTWDGDVYHDVEDHGTPASAGAYTLVVRAAFTQRQPPPGPATSGASGGWPGADEERTATARVLVRAPG